MFANVLVIQLQSEPVGRDETLCWVQRGDCWLATHDLSLNGPTLKNHSKTTTMAAIPMTNASAMSQPTIRVRRFFRRFRSSHDSLCQPR
jgi:hypothetical protein